jgi:hypothetical protein
MHDPARLMSRRVLHKHVEDIQGSHRPPSRAWRVSRTGAGGTVSLSGHWPCRTVPNSGRDGLPPGVGETAPGRDSQARQSSGATCCVRALNARTRVREQVRVGAREKHARVPLSGAGPARGGAQPSSEADLVRGAWLSPRARQTSLEGRSLCRPGGPRGPPGSWWCCVCVLGVQVDLRLHFLQVLSGFPIGYLGDP